MFPGQIHDGEFIWIVMKSRSNICIFVLFCFVISVVSYLQLAPASD